MFALGTSTNTVSLATCSLLSHLLVLSVSGKLLPARRVTRLAAPGVPFILNIGDE